MKRADPETVVLYRKLERMVRKCGPVIVDPIKVGAAFKAPTTFAGVELGKKRIYAGFLLTRRVESPRFVRVQQISRFRIEHVFYAYKPEDLDDEVQSWLREAYKAVKHNSIKNKAKNGN